MDYALPADRLLSIIEMLNEIAAEALDLDEVIDLVLTRARDLTGTEAVVFERGALALRGEPPETFAEEDVATLEVLSGVIAAHVTREEINALGREIRHDPLTGLRNRRAFDERLESEVSRARRHGGQFALCLLDLERSPHSNGTIGAVAGDEVLCAVAAHLSRVRGEDAAYRLDGRQFALVLVQASSYGAEIAIDRVATAIAEDAGCRSVSASWGLATFQRGDDAASMLARADAALYRAKARVASRN